MWLGLRTTSQVPGRLQLFSHTELPSQGPSPRTHAQPPFSSAVLPAGGPCTVPTCPPLAHLPWEGLSVPRPVLTGTPHPPLHQATQSESSHNHLLTPAAFPCPQPPVSLPWGGWSPFRVSHSPSHQEISRGFRFIHEGSNLPVPDCVPFPLSYPLNPSFPFCQMGILCGFVGRK